MFGTSADPNNSGKAGQRFKERLVRRSNVLLCAR
jgi:hypothetical protein